MAASAGSAQQDVWTIPDGQQDFDLARLQSLGEPQITTGTLWNRRANLCTAVMLRSFIDLLKLDGGHRNLKALNDCAIVISVDDDTAEAPMPARTVNGAPLTVREKVPFWAIHPFDSDAKFRTDEIYAGSVWQRTTVKVLPWSRCPDRSESCSV